MLAALGRAVTGICDVTATRAHLLDLPETTYCPFRTVAVLLCGNARIAGFDDPATSFKISWIANRLG